MYSKCRWGHAAMNRHCDRAIKYEVWELWANMSSLASPESDTIVDPWAMMIHLQDAGLAWATESLHVKPHIWAHLRNRFIRIWFQASRDDPQLTPGIPGFSAAEHLQFLDPNFIPISTEYSEYSEYQSPMMWASPQKRDTNKSSKICLFCPYQKKYLWW